MNKRISLSVLAALGLVAAAVAPRADAQIIMAPLDPASLGSSIAVTCQNPGSSQDVVKTPYLKNTTTAAIPKGKILTWKASDGDGGSVKLEADLAPGASVKAMGKNAGNGYNCTGFFFTKADLIVQQAVWAGASAVTVKVANLDRFVGAGQSMVKLEVVACSGAVLQAVDAVVPAIAQGGVATLSLAAKYPSGKSYLRVKADSTLKVYESNESNNVMDGQNGCIY